VFCTLRTKVVCFFSHTSQIVAVLNNHHDSLAWLDEKSRYAVRYIICAGMQCASSVCCDAALTEDVDGTYLQR
jgi:uncharacterized protein YutE (UPF0331/DUF86 family)